ncbi:MAG: hypothetical protein E6713_02795 [Sporomusaceae bacterium]|nr:hypothetical protein [Sporomusaceae bacterium]
MAQDEKNNPSTGVSGEEIICPYCDQRVPRGNFCAKCSKKMVEICDCWKVGHPFNCGHAECPSTADLIKEYGYSLFPA